MNLNQIGGLLTLCYMTFISVKFEKTLSYYYVNKYNYDTSNRAGLG